MLIKLTVAATLLLCLAGTFNSHEANEADPPPPRVTTQWGDIVGTWAEGPKDQATGKAPRVAQFLGIPYAEPPVGELRFEKPQPWNTKYGEQPLRAVKYSAICVHPKIIKYEGFDRVEQSEDCLTLNVWVPETKNGNLPVMVFFHGGGFALGSGGPPHNSEVLSAKQEVIVVTLNYRLGPFGFLYSGPSHEDLPGNQGLWDQNEALRWVQKNIAAFGGDPGQVSIFGVSAGSISVGAHITSPQSMGLFRNAIMMSGSMLSDIQVCTRLAAQGTRRLAAAANCPLHGPALKECLKKLSVNQLKDAFTYIYLTAVYGDEFLPVSTREALATGRGVNLDVNLLIGTMEDEGSFILNHDYPELFPAGKPAHDFSLEQAKSFLKTLYKDGPFVAELEKIYLSGDDCSAENPARIREGIVRSMSDWLACSTVEFGRLLAILHAEAGSAQKVFGYHFKRASSPLSFVCHDMNWTLGPCHGDDIPLVFGMPHMVPEMFDPDQAAFSDTVMKIWGTFAKTGSPPPQADTEWLSHEANLDTGAVKVNIMNLYGTEAENKMAHGENPFPQCPLWTRMSQYCWDSTDQIITVAMLLPGKH